MLFLKWWWQAMLPLIGDNGSVHINHWIFFNVNDGSDCIDVIQWSFDVNGVTPLEDQCPWSLWQWWVDGSEPTLDSEKEGAEVFNVDTVSLNNGLKRCRKLWRWMCFSPCLLPLGSSFGESLPRASLLSAGVWEEDSSVVFSSSSVLMSWSIHLNLLLSRAFNVLFDIFWQTLHSFKECEAVRHTTQTLCASQRKPFSFHLKATSP